MMICTGCREEKSLELFAIDGRAEDGSPIYRKQCKACRAEYSRRRRKENPSVDDRIKQRMRKWNEENPDKARKNNLRNTLKRYYGMTLEEYEEMLDSQGGVCAACGLPPTGIEKRGRVEYPTRLHVDHDHDTGEVRALLCAGCNTAFGMLGDSVERVEALLEYARVYAPEKVGR